jgi:hypothetical protein
MASQDSVFHSFVHSRLRRCRYTNHGSLVAVVGSDGCFGSPCKSCCCLATFPCARRCPKATPPTPRRRAKDTPPRCSIRMLASYAAFDRASWPSPSRSACQRSAHESKAQGQQRLWTLYKSCACVTRRGVHVCQFCFSITTRDRYERLWHAR